LELGVYLCVSMSCKLFILFGLGFDAVGRLNGESRRVAGIFIFWFYSSRLA
jgi:hypothetical protein